MCMLKVTPAQIDAMVASSPAVAEVILIYNS